MKTQLQQSYRWFVDLDGTLAVFTPVTQIETLYKKGYFERLQPQENVVEGVRRFIKENPENEVYILSSVLSDSIFAEEEKQKWLDRYLPEIDKTHRIFPPCGKNKTEYVPGGLRKEDILLDDYSLNLHEWDASGIGVKLMNGINGTKGSWKGKTLDYRLSPEMFCKGMIEQMEILTKERMFDTIETKSLRERLKENHVEYEQEGEALDYAEMAIKSIETGGENRRIPDERTIDTLGRSKEIKTIGKAISDRYIKEGGINFIGEKIESPAQLAGLFQCYRNPLYETFRVLYVKENQLIATEGVSNHLPDLCYIAFEDRKPLASHIQDRMETLHADEYYLMHNHPTGNPKPSMQDILTTRVVADTVKGFAGHIVLDHTKFSLINDSGEVEQRQVPGVLGEDIFHTAEVEHPLLNESVRNRDVLAEIGRKLIDENKENISYLIYANAAGNIQLIQEVSNALVLEKDKFEQVYRENIARSGSDMFFCVTAKEEIFEAIDDLYMDKSFTDAVYIDPDYPFYWSKSEAEIQRDEAYIFAGTKEEDLTFYYEHSERIPMQEKEEKMEKIENGSSSFMVLDSLKEDYRERPDLLLLRESDGQIIIASAWDEERKEWGSGKYYGTGSEALKLALQDFHAPDAEMVNEQQNKEISFEEGKKWWEETTYAEKFKLILESEFPEVKGQPELQQELYEEYLDTPYNRFFGDDLGEMLEEKISEKQTQKEKQRTEQKTKDKGLELE